MGMASLVIMPTTTETTVLLLARRHGLLNIHQVTIGTKFNIAAEMMN